MSISGHDAHVRLHAALRDARIEVAAGARVRYVVESMGNYWVEDTPYPPGVPDVRPLIMVRRHRN